MLGGAPSPFDHGDNIFAASEEEMTNVTTQKDPLTVARESYPELQADLNDIESSLYLEDDGNVLLALLYLTTIKQGTKKVPWSQPHDVVFREAAKAVARTSFWLRWGLFWLVPVACIGLLGLFALIPQHNDESEISYLVIVTCLITFSTVILTVAAFFYTGIFPDTSSNKANDRQNSIMFLKELYRQFGTDLLRIYAQHPPLGAAIASNIDWVNLRNLIVKRTHHSYSAFIVNDLQEAAEYISNPRDNFPHKPFLHLYLAELRRGSLPELDLHARSTSIKRPLSPTFKRPSSPGFGESDLASL